MKVFCLNREGLGNRLEAYTFAAAIRNAHGHRIYMDWPELDTLYVPDVSRGRPGLIDKLFGTQIKSCNSDEFAALSGVSPLIIRKYNVWAPEILISTYLQTSSGLGLRADVVCKIRNQFLAAGCRPMVGVHVRMGDFASIDDGPYDARTRSHLRVPLYWYEYMMDVVLQQVPDAIFLLCSNGDDADIAPLLRFPLMRLELPNPYYTRNRGHAAERHPVAELFALACCNVIIGTPVSSFTHWAANVLGERSWCILPQNGMNRQNLAFMVFRQEETLTHLQFQGISRHDCFERVELISDLAKLTFIPAECSWIHEVPEKTPFS